MTLGKLLIYVAIITIVLTVLVGVFNKKGKINWLRTVLQNYCGALFILSGWVKAVDPLGTAYKMEQYFAEFEVTFSETWLSFISPMFPWFSEYATIFSIAMIVFEIVLGIMLILGVKSKLTSWMFLILVIFFTFLTAFTYLTGYVPDGVNFFEFDNWGDWVETSMKVTDCGCFGDFLVLNPKVSFFKDIALLFPAFFFLLTAKSSHHFENGIHRAALVAVAVVGSLAIILLNGYSVGLGAGLAALGLIAIQLLGNIGGTLASSIILIVYCLANFVWDIPAADFRPFSVGKDIRTQKQLEEDSENAVEIIAYRATNKADGKVVEIPYAQYLKEFKKYPKEEWKLEQIKTEPTIKRSKISDFDISNEMGESVTEDILANPNYAFMIVAYKLKYESAMGQKIVTKKIPMAIDSVFAQEIDPATAINSLVRIDTTFKEQTKTVSQEVFNFPVGYTAPWTNVVNPVLEAAEKEGIKSFAVTAYADPALIDDFRHQTQSAYPFYSADDILLKTIVRSNPG
ncbi:MAG: putative membrane protein YphA (DoxX/SURF4 family), partial [Saprospiraceae bacterium]